MTSEGALARPTEGLLPRFQVLWSEFEPHLYLDSPRLVVAGYTGRDEATVKAHTQELAAIGIPPPDSVPCFYELDPSLLTTAPVIEVDSKHTSGEVEPVLIRHGGKYYLGIGSDHTDRDLQRVDIEASKKSTVESWDPQAELLEQFVLPLPAHTGRGQRRVSWTYVPDLGRGSRRPSSLCRRLSAASLPYSQRAQRLPTAQADHYEQRCCRCMRARIRAIHVACMLGVRAELRPTSK